MQQEGTASDWHVAFFNSTGQPDGDKIVLSRVAPNFIRLEIEAPGICGEATAARHQRVMKAVRQAVVELQEQSATLVDGLRAAR